MEINAIIAVLAVMITFVLGGKYGTNIINIFKGAGACVNELNDVVNSINSALSDGTLTSEEIDKIKLQAEELVSKIKELSGGE